jgi:hypothetical protein
MHFVRGLTAALGSCKNMRNPYMPPKSKVELNARRSLSWGKVVVYASALFLAQLAIGFFEGASAPSMARLLSSAAVSFVVCGAIFAHLAAHQPSRPFVHAWCALSLQVGAGALLTKVLMTGVDSTHFVLIALDWVPLIGSLFLGTLLGITRRHRSFLRAQQAVQPDRREDAAPV